MDEPVGLGRPKGPRFISDPFRRRAVPRRSPETVGAEPAALRPAPAGPDEVSRRAMLGTALLAVLGGALGGGLAGAVTGREEATELPQVDGGPVTGDLSKVAARVLPSVVSVQVRQGSRTATGSGFVVDRRGHVVTNAHVVGSATRADLVLDGGRRTSADVVGTDTASDIAVLRSTGVSGVAPLPLGRSRNVEVGDEVLAVGSPLGLSGTVTAGIVSALARRVRLGAAGLQPMVQTDTPINPGNSGGPLVNARGEVVGVNTAIASLGGNSGSIGIGFAVPIDRAARVARRLIHN